MRFYIYKIICDRFCLGTTNIISFVCVCYCSAAVKETSLKCTSYQTNCDAGYNGHIPIHIIYNIIITEVYGERTKRNKNTLADHERRIVYY